MSLVLNQINLVVSDMTATRAFYRLLGADVPTGEGPWADHHAEVKFANGMTLEFDSVASATTWNQGVRAPAGPAGVIIGFEVAERDDVDALHARITAEGHRSQQPPFDAFWGSRYAVVEDPDGNGIGIMSPPDAARRSAPPDPGD